MKNQMMTMIVVMFQICIALYIILSICNFNEYFMFNIYSLHVFLFEYCVINNCINLVILLSINKKKGLIALLAPYISRSCDFGPLTN